MSERLSGTQRRERILDRVRRESFVSIAALSTEHGVSGVTIHRDLRILKDSGLVERFRGGARLPSGSAVTGVTDWSIRLRRNRVAKQQIAREAIRWIEDGSTVFIDASTTCLALAQQLQRQPPGSLTLVTNSPAIVHDLQLESTHLIVAPGEVHQNLAIIGGAWAVEFLRTLNFATSFVSAAGITLEQGLTTAQRGIADVLEAVLGVSHRRVALIDSSKFGKWALREIATPQAFDAVIVDDGLDGEVVAQYRSAGVNLVVAREQDMDKGAASASPAIVS